MIVFSMCQMCSGYVTFNVSVGYVDLRYVGYWLNGEKFVQLSGSCSDARPVFVLDLLHSMQKRMERQR